MTTSNETIVSPDPMAPKGFAVEPGAPGEWDAEAGTTHFVHEGPSIDTETGLGWVFSSWQRNDGLLLNLGGQDLTLDEARRVIAALTSVVEAAGKATAE